MMFDTAWVWCQLLYTTPISKETDMDGCLYDIEFVNTMTGREGVYEGPMTRDKAREELRRIRGNSVRTIGCEFWFIPHSSRVVGGVEAHD